MILLTLVLTHVIHTGLSLDIDNGRANEFFNERCRSLFSKTSLISEITSVRKLHPFSTVSDAITVRASAGTGFRAPTPGQISTKNVSTRIDFPNGEPVAEGIFPATND